MGFFSKIFGGILNGYASRTLAKSMKNDPELNNHLDEMDASATRLRKLLASKKESNESMKDKLP